jgi:uncharacterized phiE125 gp8 family phage protein
MYRIDVEKGAVASEPITLSEAKSHIRVSNSNEDTMISAMITAAREYCENFCGRSFAQKEVVMFISELGGHNEFDLVQSPVESVDEVLSVAQDGTETALTLNGDFFIIGNNKKMIRAANSFSSEATDSLKITFTTKDECPTAIKQAILKLISAMWENRSVSVESGVQSESDLFNVRSILNAYKTRAWI